jgi:predicted nucleotidyltransferase
MSTADERTNVLADRLPAGLLDRIVAHLNPRRVIVFGSQATGTTHRDSDWDLLIVVDDDTPAERIHWRAMHEARRGIDAAIDLIPCRESTFRERIDVTGSLPWIVANEGVVVYERPDRT